MQLDRATREQAVSDFTQKGVPEDLVRMVTNQNRDYEGDDPYTYTDYAAENRGRADLLSEEQMRQQGKDDVWFAERPFAAENTWKHIAKDIVEPVAEIGLSVAGGVAGGVAGSVAGTAAGAALHTAFDKIEYRHSRAWRQREAAKQGHGGVEAVTDEFGNVHTVRAEAGNHEDPWATAKIINTAGDLYTAYSLAKSAYNVGRAIRGRLGGDAARGSRTALGPWAGSGEETLFEAPTSAFSSRRSSVASSVHGGAPGLSAEYAHPNTLIDSATFQPTLVTADRAAFLRDKALPSMPSSSRDPLIDDVMFKPTLAKKGGGPAKTDANWYRDNILSQRSQHPDDVDTRRRLKETFKTFRQRFGEPTYPHGPDGWPYPKEHFGPIREMYAGTRRGRK